MSLQNLFVAKLPRNITDADLMNIFSEFHPSSAKIMLDASTGKSKGFGFVLFDEEGSGERAFKMLNRKMTRACGHNFTLVIYPSNHNGKIFTEETNALYIRNIPMTVGQDRVERFLRTFGNLTYFAMREDHYGSPVWVIYAEYETVEEAKNALAKLHGNNTYFHGSAPILAKFEDSDDAKKERRRRREGAAGHVPSSGCIFPPPRDHHDGASSQNTNPSATLGSEAGSIPHSHGHGLGSGKLSLLDTASPHQASPGGGAAMPSHRRTPSPPSYVASVGDVPTAPTAFSMPQQLLQPTPGYCYTLADSGQQIFIPASSFSPPIASYNYSPVAQSAPPVPQLGAMPANPKAAFSLLNPESNNAVVLGEGGQQYVVAPDAINLNRDKLSTPSGLQTTLLSASSPKSLSPAVSNNVSYMGASGNAFPASSLSAPQSFFPPTNGNASSPSFLVTQTSRNSSGSPMVFVPYNAS
ncbi:putative RNA-binding protein [Leptomonas pyrrhocoris]|uniref:Putative RNA-binding protein n=1 Tax=Leptomonas pyrrhocoris TaxID=157538 RepID=A0A0M9G693_LEPPY|nr:putative RNA-binding protein [Leptomonas pyrrhocoris]KPA83263.1 putative RNA-binding protein [Leptomonas pyrrhocoris]|eukprot:XP_015661702.1 putative RNA-binding protein [Leptomonas pyrrhocoris]